MGEVQIDGNVKSKHNQYNNCQVDNSLYNSPLIQTMKSHRHEYNANKWPVIHNGGGANQKSKEMIFISHPNTVWKEDRHHCKRGVDKTGTSGVHSRRTKEKKPQRNGDSMTKEFSCSSNEYGLAKRTTECKKDSNSIENHCLISIEKNSHHSCKKSKRNENGVGAKSILCTIQ